MPVNHYLNMNRGIIIPPDTDILTTASFLINRSYPIHRARCCSQIKCLQTNANANAFISVFVSLEVLQLTLGDSTPVVLTS